MNANKHRIEGKVQLTTKSQQNEEQTEKHWVRKDTMKQIQEYTYLYTIVECEGCQDAKASLSFLLSTKIPSFMEKV